MRLLVALACLWCWGCGAIVVEVKPRTVKVDAPSSIRSGAGCSAGPFPAGEIDLEAMLKEAGVDLKQGCLKALSFGLVMELTASATATCATPRGMLTLQRVVAEMTCMDGTSKSFPVDCPQSQLDLAQFDEAVVRLNACLDRAETELAEPVRKAANECRPKLLRVRTEGSCSADACFEGNVRTAFRLNSATAQLGGSCP